MIVQTSINIHRSIMNKINEASRVTGQSRNFIIIRFLKRAMGDSRELAKLQLNKAVKYQDKDPKKRWHCFHVTYRGDMYEYCLDMRKFYKLSVSRILAFSVENYFDNVIKNIIDPDDEEDTDNYNFSSYIFVQEFIEGAVLWKQTWGIPVKLEKFLKPSDL